MDMVDIVSHIEVKAGHENKNIDVNSEHGDQVLEYLLDLMHNRPWRKFAEVLLVYPETARLFRATREEGNIKFAYGDPLQPAYVVVTNFLQRTLEDFDFVRHDESWEALEQRGGMS